VHLRTDILDAIYMHICINLYTYKYICIYMYIHTYIYIYIYIIQGYVYTYVFVNALMSVVYIYIVYIFTDMIDGSIYIDSIHGSRSTRIRLSTFMCVCTHRYPQWVYIYIHIYILFMGLYIHTRIIYMYTNIFMCEFTYRYT